MTTNTSSPINNSDVATKVGKALVNTTAFVVMCACFAALGALLFGWVVVLHNSICDPNLAGPVAGITAVLALAWAFGSRRR